MMSQDIAPALAVLVGLPFPRHMRARGDDLDLLWHIVDEAALPGAYLDDRRAALGRFRAANPAWPEIYAAGRHTQALQLSIVAGLCAAVACAAAGRRRGTVLRALGAIVFIAATAAAAILVHQHCYGSFDLSALNRRSLYERSVPGLFVAVVVAAFALRLALARDLARATADLAALAGVGLLVNLGLLWIFGAPLGFPLPTPRFLFLPIFAAHLTMAAAAVLAAASLLLMLRRPGRRRIYSAP
jgi:hypothetical protein